MKIGDKLYKYQGMGKTEQQKCVRARQATCQILAAVQPIGLRVKYIEKVN